MGKRLITGIFLGIFLISFVSMLGFASAEGINQYEELDCGYLCCLGGGYSSTYYTSFGFFSKPSSCNYNAVFTKIISETGQCLYPNTAYTTEAKLLSSLSGSRYLSPCSSYDRTINFCYSGTSICKVIEKEVSFSGGDGSQNNPYKISNCQQLQKAGEDPSKNYKLISDINCKDFFIGEETFDPIGDSTHPFSGIFDGNGKKIYNLEINRPDEDYVGLFAANYGIIIDLSLVDPKIKGRDYTGGVAGLNKHQIVGVGIYDESLGITVEGRNYVGGIAGSNTENGEISKSFVKATRLSGGILGNSLVGGIAGKNGYSPNTAYNQNSKIQNCYVKDLIISIIPNPSGTSNSVGGLAGEVDGGTIENCYANTNYIFGVTSNTGGLIGKVNKVSQLIVKNNLFYGEIRRRTEVSYINSGGCDNYFWSKYGTCVKYTEGNDGLIGTISSITTEDMSNNFWVSRIESDPEDGHDVCIGKTGIKKSCIYANVFEYIRNVPGISNSGPGWGQLIINLETMRVVDDGIAYNNLPAYFYGSLGSSRDPFKRWDFNIIWSSVSGDFPELKWETSSSTSGGSTTSEDCLNIGGYCKSTWWILSCGDGEESFGRLGCEVFQTCCKATSTPTQPDNIIDGCDENDECWLENSHCTNDCECESGYVSGAGGDGNCVTNPSTTTSCTTGEDTCVGTTYYLCQNNVWVSQGEVVGKCGIQSGTGGGTIPTTVNCNEDINSKTFETISDMLLVGDLCTNGFTPGYTFENGIATWVCGSYSCGATIRSENPEPTDTELYTVSRQGDCNVNEYETVIYTPKPNAPAGTETITRRIYCPAALPFFTIRNVIAVVILVVLVYIIFATKKQGKKSSKKRKRR